MGFVQGVRRLFGRNTSFGPQGVDWCHGVSAGSVIVRPDGKGGTEVQVKCSECNEGKWTVTHYECEKCGFDRYGTSCVRAGEGGYRVTFACTECGHSERYFQWEG